MLSHASLDASLLRERNTNANSTIVLKTYMDAGHGGVTGRYAALRELAFEMAFVMRELNLLC